MPKNGRRQFLKMLGVSPALPVVGWLPKPAPVEPQPQPQVTVDDLSDAIEKGIRDAMLAVEQDGYRAARALRPTMATAMRGYSFFDVEDD